MKLKLIKKKVEAGGTKSFFWEPEKKVEYLPGQFMYFTLPSLKFPDSRGSTRHFTLSSSPTEGNLLRLTTRIREESGYKKTLDQLEIGSIVEAEGPNGTFILDEHETGNHILLAGGIGITPFRSMIKYALDKNTGSKIYLIYSNSLPEEIAFKEELEKWSKIGKNFKVAFTITKPEESKVKWSGLTGRIDEILIKKLVPSAYLLSSTFWVVGPPPMVDAMENVLDKLDVSGNQIRTEKFTGY